MSEKKIQSTKISFSNRKGDSGELHNRNKIWAAIYQCIFFLVYALSCLQIFFSVFTTNTYDVKKLVVIGLIGAAIIYFFYEKRKKVWQVNLALFIFVIVLAVRFRETITAVATLVGNDAIDKINSYFAIYLEKFPDVACSEEQFFWGMFFCMLLLIWWAASSFFSGRNIFNLFLPAVFFLILDLCVGYAPDKKAVFLLFFAVVMAMPFAGHHEWKNNMLSQRLLAGVILLLTGGFCLFLANQYETDFEESVEAQHKQVLTYQAALEKTVTGGSLFDFFSGHDGRISNQAPSYDEKEVIEVTVSQLPANDIFLRGYVGDTYQRGKWVNTSEKDFEEAVAEWKDVDTQAAALEIQNMLGENESRLFDASQISYQISYLEDNGEYAYLPYFTDLNSAEVSDSKGLTLSGDNIVLREQASSVTVQGNTDNSILWTIAVEGLQNAYVKNYQTYLEEKYLSTPEELRQIQSLGEELREEFETEYSFLLENTENYNTINIRELLAAYFVREKIAGMASYSLSLEDVPVTEDVLQYFLYGSGQGFCQHYAGAGVLLLRELGVFARYATGYHVSLEDFVENADGSSTAKVLDSDAHAWVEIYIEGIGWIPVDMTEGTGSDWDKMRISQDESAGNLMIYDGGLVRVFQDQTRTQLEGYLGSLEQLLDENEENEQQEDTETANSENSLDTTNNANNSHLNNSQNLLEEEKNATEAGNPSEEEKNEGTDAPGTAANEWQNVRFWYGIAAGLLLIGLAVVVCCRLAQIKKKRSVFSEYSNRRRVLFLANQTYRLLVRKRKISAFHIEDKKLEQCLRELLQEQSEAEIFMGIVRKAAYSNEPVTKEEVIYCRKFYQKLKLIQKAHVKRN